MKLAHHLGNTISALKLRLEQVTQDTTCVWAQGDNLKAMGRLIQEALMGADRLEEAVRAASTGSPGPTEPTVAPKLAGRRRSP